MNQTNPPPSEVKEVTINSSLKLVEIPYKVKVPVFEDVEVKKAVFVDEQVIRPLGIEKLIVELVDEAVSKLFNKIDLTLIARLDAAIDTRIKEIKYPKLVEEVTVTHKSVEVERPVFKDVEVSRPTFKDVEVINPIIKNVEVVNAVVVDQTVINADIKDIKVTNAIITDVPVDRAVIREQIVNVTHKMCHDQNGNPL